MADMANSNSQTTSFAQALNRTHEIPQELRKAFGTIGDQDENARFSEDASLLEEERKRALRQEQHNLINPPDQHELFVAEKQETNQKLAAVRQWFAEQHPEAITHEVDIALQKNDSDPGLEGGKYHISFYEKMKSDVIESLKRLQEILIPQSGYEYNQNRTARKGKLRGHAVTRDQQNKINNPDSNRMSQGA